MMTWVKSLVGLVLLGLATSASAQISDPLAAQIERDDAERFIAMWHSNPDSPSAELVQSEYIDKGSEAVAVFTPHRIVDGANMARAMAENREDYAYAIDHCYPWIEDADRELRATYLALKGLFPEKSLPRIAIVFGAGNSGGTAAPGWQVLGLEVLCRDRPDEAEFRSMLRGFFAHETIHSLQDIPRESFSANPMLFSALSEGGADYLAWVATGLHPKPERNAWASERREWVLQEFATDMAIVKDASLDPQTRNAAYSRWFANAGSAPEGWPSELGYWVGMKIAQRFVENSDNPQIAIRRLISFTDPAAILEEASFTF